MLLNTVEFRVDMFVVCLCYCLLFFFFFQAEDGIRDVAVTGVQTCALPISPTRVGFADSGDRAQRPAATGSSAAADHRSLEAGPARARRAVREPAQQRAAGSKAKRLPFSSPEGRAGPPERRRQQHDFP